MPYCANIIRRGAAKIHVSTYSSVVAFYINFPDHRTFADFMNDFLHGYKHQKIPNYVTLEFNENKPLAVELFIVRK